MKIEIWSSHILWLMCLLKIQCYFCLQNFKESGEMTKNVAPKIIAYRFRDMEGSPEKEVFDFIRHTFIDTPYHERGPYHQFFREPSELEALYFKRGTHCALFSFASFLKFANSEYMVKPIQCRASSRQPPSITEFVIAIRCGDFLHKVEIVWEALLDVHAAYCGDRYIENRLVRDFQATLERINNTPVAQLENIIAYYNTVHHPQDSFGDVLHIHEAMFMRILGETDMGL